MTTIAYDGITLAADTQTTDGYGLKGNAVKLHAGRCWIAGFSGSTGLAKRFILEHGDDKPQQLLSTVFNDAYKDDLSVLLVVGEKPYILTQSVFIEVDSKQHAIGSGRDYALMAMRLGKTAEEAVRLASEFDAHTGHEVITL